jgi:hypothetical protein
MLLFTAFLLSGCRRVAGSEGFAVQDVVLVHEAGSEGSETSGDYQRSWSGEWLLIATGGGPCVGYEDPVSGSPSGEGWEEAPRSGDGSGERRTLCDTLSELAPGFGVYGITAGAGPKNSRALTLYMADYFDDSAATPPRESLAILTACGPSETGSTDASDLGYADTETHLGALDDFEIVYQGATARVTAELADELFIDWTLPVCEVDAGDGT